MLAYLNWDEELHSIFAPLTAGGVRARSLPQSARVPNDVEEDVTWLFPEWKLINESTSLVYRFEVVLLVTLYLSKRYDDPRTPPGSIEAIENWILSQLCGRCLLGTCSPLTPKEAKLFAPNRGRWYKEIRFSFEARGTIDRDSEGNSGLVEIIRTWMTGEDLWQLP